MPVGWIEFSTASTPAAKRCRTDPEACESELEGDLATCGARLEGGLLFAVDRSIASGRVRDLDVAPNACRKGVLEKWGARYYKAMTAVEAAAGFRHAARLTAEPGAEFVAPEETEAGAGEEETAS